MFTHGLISAAPEPCLCVVRFPPHSAETILNDSVVWLRCQLRQPAPLNGTPFLTTARICSHSELITKRQTGTCTADLPVLRIAKTGRVQEATDGQFLLIVSALAHPLAALYTA
jgi:hypothetical protein